MVREQVKLSESVKNERRIGRISGQKGKVECMKEREMKRESELDFSKH